MEISQVTIKNFRGIKDQSFNAKELSLFIGNNGTGKTSILEAINFALSPHFLSGRIKHTDFYLGNDNPIIIQLQFDSVFRVNIPDGYTKRSVDCNGIYLEIKKRDKGSPGKTFSDVVVVTHYAVPNRPKDNEDGWEITRKSGSKFQFDERLLSLSQIETEDLPRSFYFNKNRERQLQKGFNSSLSTILDDFNWRFLKGLRKEEAEKAQFDLKNGNDNFFARKNKLEQEIISKVDETSVKKSFDALNKKLEDFGLSEVGLVFIDGQFPFNNAFLAQKINNLDLPISNLGSGIEMIISLLCLETLASLSKENLIILIDEPELHLHPSLQEKFLRYLLNFSKDNQVFLSTHSPYFFKNCLNNSKVELLITKLDSDNITIQNTGEQFGLFPWSPSWGEINYSAYGLPTVEFHNELYGYIQEKTQKYTIEQVENYFVSEGISKTKKWAKVLNGQLQPPEDVTLMTFIRNSIHHPENTNNGDYSLQELEESIKKLIEIVKNINKKNLPPSSAKLSNPPLAD